MNNALRIINALLLAAILAVLILIFQRMPITLADFKNADPEDRKALFLKQTLVHLRDTVSVEIQGTPSVEIDNVPRYPFKSNVETAPAEV